VLGVRRCAWGGDILLKLPAWKLDIVEALPVSLSHNALASTRFFWGETRALRGQETSKQGVEIMAALGFSKLLRFIAAIDFTNCNAFGFLSTN